MYHCIVRFYSLIQLTQNLPNDFSLGFYLGDIKSLRITKVISLLVWCGMKIMSSVDHVTTDITDQ